MWGWRTGQPPAKGKSPGLCSGMIDGLWHWLMIWGLLHPRTLVCAEWLLQWCLVQKSSTSVINLHRYSIGCPPRKTYDAIILQYWLARRRCTLGRQSFPITRPYECEMSNLNLWPDIWYRASVGWFLSVAEALMPHLHEHDNLGDSWQSIPCAFCADLP